MSPDHYDHRVLRRLTAAIFAAAGSDARERTAIADRLVEANLAGHDSHGVIRVRDYVAWLREGKVVANQRARVMLENEAIAVVDGGLGFGQVIGEEAMALAIAKSSRHGVAVVAVRNCGHLGRIGDWPLQAASAGKFSLHFVNTSGFGILVAPYGGIERRLSANPIAAGIPVPGGEPLILDISTCAIAEGKIKVALNQGAPLPAGSVIDARGRPTTEARDFYADPPGSILPFGGHKGYALGIVAEMLAGALTGNGCTAPGVDRLSNGMLAIVIDPGFLQDTAALRAEIERFVGFVKSSQRTSSGDEILMPGELERRTRRRRIDGGIPLDAVSWSQYVAAGVSVGLPPTTFTDALAPRALAEGT